MKILRMVEVTEKTGLSRWTIYRKEDTGEFPKRVRLGPNAVGWLEDEIEAWLTQRILERDEQDIDTQG